MTDVLKPKIACSFQIYFRKMVNSLCVCFAFASLIASSMARTTTKTLTVANGGPWGIWGQPSLCADGYYAVGFDMKVR